MSKPDTWMPLYIGDYLADTAHLSMAEHGAYFLLIMAYWRKGPLPDDDKYLANIAKCDRKLWGSEIGPVIREFFTAKDGKLHHKRIDQELADAEANTAKKRAAAEARWGAKPKQTASGGDAGGKPDAYAHASAEDDAKAIQETCPYAGALPSPSPKEERKEDRSLCSLPRRQAVEAADFADFWQAYPRKVGKDAARKAWLSALKRASPADIADGLNRQRWPDDPQFIPHPATWLNGGRWADDPEAAAPPKPERLSAMDEIRRDWDLPGLQFHTPRLQ